MYKELSCHFPGQVSSGLDHFYTNVPRKISSIQKFHWGGSDHMLIKAVRTSKIIQSCQSYIRRQSYKNFFLFIEVMYITALILKMIHLITVPKEIYLQIFRRNFPRAMYKI